MWVWPTAGYQYINNSLAKKKRKSLSFNFWVSKWILTYVLKNGGLEVSKKVVISLFTFYNWYDL